MKILATNFNDYALSFFIAIDWFSTLKINKSKNKVILLENIVKKKKHIVPIIDNV